MAVTEAGCSIVKPGIDVMDDSTPEGQILLKIWKGVTSQPTGPYRVFWGTEVETPANLWGFFDFASVEEHEKFAEEYVQPNPGEHHCELIADHVHQDLERISSQTSPRSLAVTISQSTSTSRPTHTLP